MHKIIQPVIYTYCRISRPEYIQTVKAIYRDIQTGQGITRTGTATRQKEGGRNHAGPSLSHIQPGPGQERRAEPPAAISWSGPPNPERRPASRPGDDTGPAGLTGTRSQEPAARDQTGARTRTSQTRHGQPLQPGDTIRPAPGPVSPPPPLSPPSLGLPHPIQEGSGAPAPGPDQRGAGGVRGARAPWE